MRPFRFVEPQVFAEPPHTLLSGVGYLVEWDPEDPRHRRLPLPVGWYGVRVIGGVLDGDPEQWALSFVLQQSEERPPFTADPNQAFDWYPEIE